MTRNLGPNWAKEPGCKSKPLFKIEPDHVVFDELHMFLRIMDRMENGLVMEVLDWDEVKKNYIQ